MLLSKLTQTQMTRNGVTQSRIFTYDQGGRGALLMSAQNPENGTVYYTYNPDGTLATRRDANNQTVNYGYDSLKRLTQVSRPSALIGMMRSTRIAARSAISGACHDARRRYMR